MKQLLLHLYFCSTLRWRPENKNQDKSQLLENKCSKKSCTYILKDLFFRRFSMIYESLNEDLTLQQPYYSFLFWINLHIFLHSFKKNENFSPKKKPQNNTKQKKIISKSFKNINKSQIPLINFQKHHTKKHLFSFLFLTNNKKFI